MLVGAETEAVPVLMVVVPLRLLEAARMTLPLLLTISELGLPAARVGRVDAAQGEIAAAHTRGIHGGGPKSAAQFVGTVQRRLTRAAVVGGASCRGKR